MLNPPISFQLDLCIHTNFIKNYKGRIKVVEMLIYISPDFALINEFGHPIMTHQTEGLLLHKDGTVRSDGFSDMSAHSICRELGYHAAATWRTGLVYSSQQSSRDVALSKVTCSTDDWSACFSNSTSADEEMDHEEDVLLSCEYGMLLLIT